MIESFKRWVEGSEAGLADAGFVDQGRPRIKNKKIHDKYRIPAIPAYDFEKDRGMATKTVEGKAPLGDLGTYPKKNKTLGIPKYKFDVTQVTGTRLDPGS